MAPSLSAARHPIYELIFSRRDVRRFLPRPIPEPVLSRILTAAHHAPSVGFMQPWNFIVIRDPAVKARVKGIFLAENAKASGRFRGKRRGLYEGLKLEGITEAPVNLCVTCDPKRFGPHVLGRNTIRRTDVYSTCCAVQNLWLAARAEGLGVGWVSILRNDRLKRILGIPARVIPVAYLCVGFPVEFLKRPELESVGWAPRLSLARLIFLDRWGRWGKEQGGGDGEDGAQDVKEGAGDAGSRFVIGARQKRSRSGHGAGQHPRSR